MARKGQAALEFLMTYGWAILVVLVVIGALAYFGVLNPSALLPEKCTLPPGLSCQDYLVSSTGGVTLNLQNGFGEQITITGINVTSVDSGLGYGCTDSSITPAAPLVVNNGDIAKVTMSGAIAGLNCTAGANALQVGSKPRLKIEYSYFLTKSGSTFAKTMDGEMISKVQ